ncbi:hypothetical protein N9X26_03215 [Candidatus Actinomarina sp.]|jgi:hypothetical protein|nr:hypothetical protein [Candidatus Actinomarina sp.]
MIKSSILMMVITSDTYPANRNTRFQKKIYSKVGSSNFIVWYKGNKNLRNKNLKYMLDDRDLLLDCSDDTRSMGKKTLLAFEWALKHVDFEYLVRPTPSSYVNLEFFKDLNLDTRFQIPVVYAGTVHKKPHLNNDFFEFVSGSTLILNKTCVEIIVKNKNLWNHELWDDVALADLMNQLSIKPLDIQRFDVKGNIFKQNIDLNNYQYRCRADNHYNYPRIIEANLLTIIHDLITNGKITIIKKFFYYFYFEILKIFYIREFIWKIYLATRRILKLILPTYLYRKLKKVLQNNLVTFKHKRFKY